MKKRKIWTWVGIVLFVATLWLGWSIYYNLNGPPWGEWMMKRGAMKYLEEKYPKERFRIVEVEKRRPLFYGWILNVFVVSEEHPEETFDLAMTFQGEVREDHRRLRQQERYFHKIQEEYQLLVKEALGSEFVTEEGFFQADLSPGTSMGDPGSFNVEDLDPEGEVDLRAMSKVRGMIELQMPAEERSIEEFIRLFTEIRSRLDRAGLTASAIRLELMSKDHPEEPRIDFYLPKHVKTEELANYLSEQAERKKGEK